MTISTPHHVLGISPHATQAEIRSAYRKRAQETHPDSSGGSHEEFIRVQAAYRALTDLAYTAKFGGDSESAMQAAYIEETRKAQLQRRKRRLLRLYEY